LQTNAQSFYADMIAARQPALTKKSLPSISAKKTKIVRPISETGGFRFAARIIDPLYEDDRDKTEPAPRPELQLVDDLLKVGMKESAQRQLNSISWTNYEAEDSFAAASRLAWMLNDYQPTRRLKFRNFSSLRFLPSGWWDLLKHQKTHLNEWKVYFPLAFRKMVENVTEKVSVSKYLLLSIMRAESFYNKDARSGVGARGLMQIMPYTAVKIAKLLGDSDFEVASLSEPEVSIGYGGYYLKKLLNYYSENPYVAVAAYNAGPIAVNRWLAACVDCSADEFVETIPYRETRHYVREVIRNYAQYLRIYETKDNLPQLPPMPDNLPSELEIF
jgi:soluble lytic murein transglycosylase-like protein